MARRRKHLAEGVNEAAGVKALKKCEGMRTGRVEVKSIQRPVCGDNTGHLCA